MGKIVRIAAAVVGIAALVVPGVGTAISAAIGSALTAGAGVYATTSFAIGQALTMGLIASGLSSGLQFATKVLGIGPKPPKIPGASVDRLRASLDLRAARKIVFGHTAAATDVRYQEFTGTDQEYLNSIIVLASHTLESIDEIWFDEKMAWSASGGVTSDFTGYLTVTAIEAGTTGNAFTITGSSSWTSGSSRMVGCAYLWLRYKLTGNTKKAESPFSSNVTSRITVRVKGAPLYDPRLDTTVGGSGSHRADDQTTWAWVSDDVGRNPALQLLFYLLGWKIQNPATSAWSLAVGLGLPVARIDIDSFIAAANLCDEPVALAGGGTEPRYRADGVFSEGDDPSLVFENLLSAMNGVLRDAGGKLALDVLHNDLASPVADFDENDVIGEFTWIQTPPIDQIFNSVRGRYVNASNAGLYQMVDYPDVSLASPDGIERSQGLDLALVQSASQAQRLAKQYLQRAQYPGSFTASFLASAWRVQVGSVVRLSFAALGFENKLFRVIEHTISMDGTCPMVLKEENAAIYAWDADEAPAVTAAGAIAYDPLNEPWVQAVAEVEAAAGVYNDLNALTPDAPVFTVQPSLIQTWPGGEVTLRGEFTFTASDDPDHKNSIDEIEYRIFESTGSGAHTFADAVAAGETVGSFVSPLSGTFPIQHRTGATTYVTYGARVVRHVQSSVAAGERVYSAWAVTSPAVRAGSAQNYTGNVGGVSATDVANTTTVWGSTRHRLTITPTAIGIPSGGACMNHTMNADGSCDLSFTCTFSGTASSQSGFEQGLYASTSASAYTPGTTPSQEDIRVVPIDRLTTIWQGVNPTLYYTAFRRTYRDADPDAWDTWAAANPTLAATTSKPRIVSAWVKSTVAGENPYQPAANAAISNAIFYDTAGGTSMTTALVITNATKAATAINTDFTIANGKVVTASIASDAINNKGYATLTTLVALAASDTYTQDLLGTSFYCDSTVLVVDVLCPVFLEVTNPVQGTKYSITFTPRLKQISSGIYFDGEDVLVEEVWQAPTTTGTFELSRRWVSFSHRFTGLIDGNYSPAIRAVTPAGNGATLPRYRYLTAEDPRAIK